MFKQKKQLGIDALLDTNPRTKSSAVHLLLYKQMLQQLSKDYDTPEDIPRIQQIDREIVRCDGLNIDESLNNFTRENQDILRQLILLECNDFQKPYIRKIMD